MTSYATLRKKEYEKASFKSLQAEAFCDLLSVVLPNSKLPQKVREFKGVLETIKATYPNPNKIEKNYFIYRLIRKVF
jgi:hypothetical protein